MALFPHLDLEDAVQENDRTRIDASKSFASPDEGGFDTLLVSPSRDTNPIDIYAQNAAERHLDWEYDFKIDVDGSNEKFDVQSGGAEHTATLTNGTYTLADLITELQTQLNTLGIGSFTCSVGLNGSVTISNTIGFKILIDGTNRSKTLAREMFFSADDLKEYSTSITSGVVERLKRRIIVTQGEDKKQISQITCAANTAHALAGKYFLIFDDINSDQYYVWYSDGTGSDPAPAGYTAIAVTLSNGDTAAQVATATAAALSSNGFTAAATGAVVTSENSQPGLCNSPRDGTSDFAFEIKVYGQLSVTEISYIYVYSEAGDRLFSTDADLETEEPEIRKFVKAGRNTFKDIHRAAQKKILEYLDRKGYVNTFDDKYTKWDIEDLTEVSEWSRYMVLRMIFESVKGSIKDSFKDKRDVYEAEELDARDRAILRIDTDRSGQVDDGEGIDSGSTRLFMR